MNKPQQIFAAVMQLKLHGARPTKLVLTRAVYDDIRVELGLKSFVAIAGVPIEIHDASPSIDSGRLLDPSGEEIIEEQLGSAGQGFFKA